MAGRAAIDRMPPEVRDAVHEAIREGVTIDQIRDRILELGAECSRAAVGAYVKRANDMVRRQREADRIAEIWVREIGERPEGRVGRLAIETLRTTALALVRELGERVEGGDPVSPKELNMLALALQRMENAGKVSTDRELTIRRDAATKAVRAIDGKLEEVEEAAAAGGDPMEAVRRVRREVYGILDD